MNRSPGPISIVVMGASGCGKSTVGRELAARLGLEFKDGDDLHPATNVSKMAAGDPLTDEDRWPWLTLVGQWLAERSASGSVVACSALRRAYRDVLRDAAGKDTLFVYLDLPEAVLLERVKARDHFFPPHLLTSQLATLEALHPDEVGVRVEGTLPVAELVEQVAQYLAY